MFIAFKSKSSLLRARAAATRKIREIAGTRAFQNGGIMALAKSTQALMIESIWVIGRARALGF